MKHAEALGLRREDSNPCKGLRRRKTGFEAHYLTDDEFAALGRALDGAEADYPVAVAVLRFLLYTGARKSEALRLKWEHIHGDRAVLPDSKTGPRTIWLGSPARAVLAARHRRTNCPWVFASVGGGPATVDKEWNAIRAAAGLPALRIHDLRHSHAAVAVNRGEGLRVVAGLLGHADIATTFGYAHLAEGSPDGRAVFGRADAALRDAPAEPALHRRDARQAAGRAGRTKEGGSHAVRNVSGRRCWSKLNEWLGDTGMGDVGSRLALSSGY